MCLIYANSVYFIHMYRAYYKNLGINEGSGTPTSYLNRWYVTKPSQIQYDGWLFGSDQYCLGNRIQLNLASSCNTVPEPMAGLLVTHFFVVPKQFLPARPTRKSWSCSVDFVGLIARSSLSYFVWCTSLPTAMYLSEIKALPVPPHSRRR